MTDETVSVVVPAYRRAEHLRRCLAALERQTRPADELIVVVRSEDRDSRDAAAASAAIVEADEPGVVAAMRAGVAVSTGDVVAFTDDDAEPRPGWLEGLLALLAEPGVGAAGGRDVIPGVDARACDVGRFRAYGKLVGNHHLGAGPHRDVDVLKGVSMAFRAAYLALPAPGVLRGEGAEVDFEILCSRWAAKQSARLVYDPAVEVDHAVAERHGADRRTRPDRAALSDSAHNFLVATTALDPSLLARQALYALLLGSRRDPGLGRAVLAVARGEWDVAGRLLPSVRGSLAASARLLRGLPAPVMLTCEELRARRPVEAAAA